MQQIQGTNTVVHITKEEDHVKLKSLFPMMSYWTPLENYYIVSLTNPGRSYRPYPSNYVTNGEI